MKKYFLPIILFCLLSVIFIPAFAHADGIVTCQGPSDCNFDAFKGMLKDIYGFIIGIAAPLAILAITAGAILMMVSAGNPSIMSIGKKVFWSAVIGLILVYASQEIINLVINSMGGTPI